jgi:tRNA-binding EMAP/Myf-like protein
MIKAACNTRFAASGGKLCQSKNLVLNEKSSYLKILSLDSPPGANRGNVIVDLRDSKFRAKSFFTVLLKRVLRRKN